MLTAPCPSLGSKFNDAISLAGQSWSRSLDGNPEGRREPEPVAGRVVGGVPPRVCFRSELAPDNRPMPKLPRNCISRLESC